MAIVQLRGSFFKSSGLQTENILKEIRDGVGVPRGWVNGQDHSMHVMCTKGL